MNKRTSGRIAFFIPTLAQGGGERVVSVLSLHFPERAVCSLVVFEKSISYPFSGDIISLDVPLSRNPFKRAWGFWVRLFRFRGVISSAQFDAVISVGNAPNLINLLVNRRKAVLRADLPPSQSTPGFWGLLYRAAGIFLFRRAKRIVAVSRFIEEDLQERFGVAPQNITVIPNPIDGEEIRRLAREPIPSELEHLFEGPVVVTMGRLTHQKGQWHLLRAFATVHKQVPDARLIMLGEGELHKELEQLRHALGLDSCVYFFGWQKNPFAFLARSDVFVLSSLWEGLPDALLEAMACRLPVVSFDCRSGPREILAPSSDFRVQTEHVEETEYGVLVPVGEETALASAIVSLLKDARLREHFERKSSERASQYDVSAIMPQWDFLWDT
jgi:glycosyltransferase involved in cell wall biosynthesis